MSSEEADRAPARRGGRLALRLLLTASAGLAAAVAAAVALAVADMALTGRGRPGLRETWLAYPPAGIHLSPADVILLVAVALAAVAGWRVGGRR